MADLSSDKVTMNPRTGPRGRTNDGSACRPLFYALTANRALATAKAALSTYRRTSPPILMRSTSTVRLGDQIHHGYDLVLDCTVTPWRVNAVDSSRKRAASC